MDLKSHRAKIPALRDDDPAHLKEKLTLGPMPESVRGLVSRLMSAERPGTPNCDERLNGFLLAGGPGGCCFLDAEGEVWSWSTWDDSVEPISDGPLKVGLVAFAAKRVRELAEWLPSPPVGAADCLACRGDGRLPPPYPRIGCPECSGLGWVAPSSGC